MQWGMQVLRKGMNKKKYVFYIKEKGIQKKLCQKICVKKCCYKMICGLKNCVSNIFLV